MRQTMLSETALCSVSRHVVAMCIREEQADISRHAHAHTHTHARNAVPDTDCATSMAEKLHGPIRHTSGFKINNHLKSSAGLPGV